MNAALPSALVDSATRRASAVWLFSRSEDLWAFVAPTIASLLLVAIGCATGAISGDTPPVLWLACVLFVDVAHVWSTVYRVYADSSEVRRRPVLYLGTPVLAYAAGVGLYLHGMLSFWRVLAYAAVFHFVRQQYGWMMLYRHRLQERDALGKLIDGAAIYLATLYPLLWWHAAPARRFNWFVAGDFFVGLPARLVSIAGALYATALTAYVIRALAEVLGGRSVAWGKHLLLTSTAVCWYSGIVFFNSDYAFTVTNVLIHGVPYFVLVWRYGRRRFTGPDGVVNGLFRAGWPIWFLTLVTAAFCEEGLWDQLAWHEHAQFFGNWGLQPSAQLLAWIVPLLALPQAVHYVLDGFVWRVNDRNPGLKERLGLT